jgi:Tfp pilus assembly protein PilV
MHRSHVLASRPKEGGFSILTVLLALVVTAVIAAGQIQAQQLQSKQSAGRLQGDVLKLLKDAANNYTMEGYSALQLDQPVTKESVTLANGAGAGQSFSPTVANLIAMGYLPANTSSTAQLNAGTYRVRLEKIPAGCAGVACNITGVIYIDQPIRTPGTTEMAGIQVGSLIDAVGGDVVVAMNTNPSVLVGVNGASVPNPVAGSPDGVVGARVGFGASGFGRFLVLNDPRDPHFQGPVSIAGNVTIGGSTTFNGDVNVNNCVRLQQDGRGGFNCLDPNDLPGGFTGGVRAVDLVASGNVLASDSPSTFTGNNTNFALMSPGAPGLEAMVKTSGQVAGDRLIPTGSYTPGTACTDVGAMARSTASASGGVLVVCTGVVWSPLSTVAVAGGACPVEGQGAVDAQGRQLYCFNGTWTYMTDFLPPAMVGGTCSVPGAIGYTVPVVGGGASALVCKSNPSGGVNRWFRIQDITTHLVFVTAYEVTHGTVVAKPACGVAAGQTVTPIPQLIPKVESSDDSGFSRFVIDNGGSWTVQLTNGAGAALSASPSASAVLHVYCYYQ